LGCVNSPQANPDWHQLDSFAALHLSLGELKTSRLEDGTLIGQFEITNRTDQPITVKYKWLWLDSDDISIDHAQKKWKVTDLGPAEERHLQSRTAVLQATRPFIRISSFWNDH
jgi:uncharacterized protein YcfL